MPFGEQQNGKIMVRLPDGSVVNMDDMEIDEAQGFAPDGTEGILPSFPVIKIATATSRMDKADKNAGSFWCSDTEEYSESIDVVGLVARNTRALFSDDRSIEKPLCMSTDGRVPLADQPLWGQESVDTRDYGTLDVPEATPSNCAACPFSQWGEGTDGKQHPPVCRESLVLLVAREDGQFATLRLGGTNIKPFRQMVATKLKPKALALCTQALRLTTERKQANGNTWYEIVWQATPLPRKLALFFNQAVREQQARFDHSIEAGGEDVPEATADDGWEDA